MAYGTFARLSGRVQTPLWRWPRNDALHLNAAATRLLEKSGVKAVKILWDKTTCGIALQAAHKNDKDSYSLAFSEGYHSATLAAKAFIRHIGWSAPSRETVFAKWNEQKKLLEAQLPSSFVGTGGKKSTRKEDTGL